LLQQQLGAPAPFMRSQNNMRGSNPGNNFTNLQEDCFTVLLLLAPSFTCLLHNFQFAISKQKMTCLPYRGEWEEALL
jgi:hypothetical protein